MKSLKIDTSVLINDPTPYLTDQGHTGPASMPRSFFSEIKFHKKYSKSIQADKYVYKKIVKCQLLKQAFYFHIKGMGFNVEVTFFLAAVINDVCQ